MKIELVSEDHFTVTDVLLSEKPVILTVKRSTDCIYSYKANAIWGSCRFVVNNEKVCLTKEDLALSNTKIEYWFKHFDWSEIEFKYQDKAIFFHLQDRFLDIGNLKLRTLITCLDTKNRIEV